VKRITEHEAIAGPMQDTRFVAFYQAERAKIGLAVEWYADVPLPPATRGRFFLGRHGDGTTRAAIHLPRRWSPSTVAHEITHLKLMLGGYPYIFLRPGAPAGYAVIGCDLANAVQDTIICERVLSRYGWHSVQIGDMVGAVALARRNGLDTPEQARRTLDQLIAQIGAQRYLMTATWSERATCQSTQALTI